MRLNHEGQPRHVGVEIEFAAVSAKAATGIVQSLFGGTVETIDPHLYRVVGTELGDFQCELDFQYAHLPDQEEGNAVAASPQFASRLREIIGNVGSLLAPCEVVCPPIEITRLGRIEDLRKALRKAGAEGTGENFFYAFGAQLNPEIASKSPAYITSVMKSYLLLSEWLRLEIGIDPTRELLAFAEPFPPAYCELLLAGDYEPELDCLIDDYLAYNPTRNRELDMLPLFFWLDPERIREALDNALIKPRPTFHYRLPNARLQDPGWTITAEWNRWCQVEHLAADGSRLEQARSAWMQSAGQLFGDPWSEEVKKWLV